MNTSKTSQTDEQPSSSARSIAKSTGMMSALILVSRITGFIRTWAMAFALGNTFLAASYSLANNLPNMIYELVAGGVLSTAFLPIYMQQRNAHSREAANDYVSNLLSIAVVFLGLVSLAASIFAPQVMVTQSLFSSASNDTVEAAVWFFRFFAFQIVFYGLSAIFSGVLNAERRYFWPSVSSVFMNIITIVTFFGYPLVNGMGTEAGIIWLAVGTTLSIAVLAFVQVPALVKSGYRFRFFIDLHGEGLRDTVKLALPAIACTAINLVSLSFMNSTALHVADNGPSSVSYAWMWYQFPYGVLGVALSTAMFTEMSDAMSRGDYDRFKRQLNFGLRTTWLLIIPMAVMVFVCAAQLIGLYSAGRFTAQDIAPIANLLRGWAIALPLYAGYMFLYRAYSSLKDLKTIALCNLFLTVVQVFLYMLLTGVITLPGLPTLALGLIGIPCGDIVFYALMMVLLLLVLRRRIGGFEFESTLVSTCKVLIASIIGGAVSAALIAALGLVLDLQTIGGSLVALVVAGGIGLALIFVLCRMLGITEVATMARRIAEKVRRR